MDQGRDDSLSLPTPSPAMISYCRPPASFSSLHAYLSWASSSIPVNLSHPFHSPHLSPFPRRLNAPPIPLLPLLPLLLAVPHGVHLQAGDGVDGRQAHGGQAHGAAGGEALAQALGGAATGGEEEVEAGPGGGQAGAVDFEAANVEVACEEEGGGEEEHGQGLEGAGVEGGDEGCEAHGGHGGY